MFKKCTACKAEKELSGFWRNRTTKDGHHGQCIECAKEYKKRPEVRRRKRKADQKWYREGGREVVKAYQQGPEYKKTKRRTSVKYRNNYPERLLAQNALIYAVRSRRIDRPDQCSRCGVGCVPHGHHGSYGEESWLDVDWLCGPCHGEHHRKDQDDLVLSSIVRKDYMAAQREKNHRASAALDKITVPRPGEPRCQTIARRRRS